MKKILFTLIFLLTICSSNLHSQNNIVEDFPFKVGNMFVYKTEVWGFPNYHNVSISNSYISKDTIINSRTYFYINSYAGKSNSWWRLDSTTGNLFVYDASNSCPNYFQEKLVDSLFSSLNDTAKGCGSGNYYCNDIFSQTLFNLFIVSKSFYKYAFYGFGYSDETRVYSEKFGYIGGGSNSHGGGGTSSVNINLIGCKVNGILYGDTNIVHVLYLLSEMPERYSLHQNYPNPFNPSTRINYELRNSNYVTLKVFDLLGKEVATLVNEKQNAGSYAVDFNSTEFNLPSGIYFYTLNAGEFKETRRMVLTK